MTQKYRNTHYSVPQQLDNATLQKNPSPTSILYELHTCRPQRFHHLLGINCSHHHNHNHSNKKVLILLPNYCGIWFTVIVRERRGGGLRYNTLCYISAGGVQTRTHLWGLHLRRARAGSQWYADIPWGTQWLTLWHIQ